MKLTVIIVNYNVKYFLEVCLHSVLKASESVDTEIIVVDNNSTDGSCEFIRRRFPSVVLIENKDNKGFSKANNQGVAIAKGEYILFLNPDTVMPEDFLDKLVGYMDKNPDAGAIGPRLMDGKGVFSPDGKKSFPTLSVAIFKTIGLNKLFPRSALFNRYYAVHIPDDQVAEVEVLSGCCMLVRRTAMERAGGAFDEDFFMYCEDVDLSYRIQKAGYKNIYYPPATLIHYKGESTKKATLSYVRTFNEALVKFVKKHYTKGNATAFVFFINIGIILRAILGACKRFLKILKMPLFDALILLATLWFMKEFWVVEVKNIDPIPLSSVIATFPVYIGLWILSLYLNGVYDQSYRALRVIRGMIIGTIVILAYYGLLQPGLRYSRAIIVLSGFVGTVSLLGLHELLYRIGVLKFIRYDKLPRKAVIVGEEVVYEQTAEILQKVHYAPVLSGRISPKVQDNKALAGLADMRELLFTAGINEVIFCVNGLTYASVLQQMQHCGSRYEYKIHIAGSQSFVGSNSSHTSGDLYTIDKRYNLNSFSQLRNKRLVDILFSLLCLILYPVLLFVVRHPLGLLGNIFTVLAAQKTWIGYSSPLHIAKLPKLRPAILPPYFVLKDFSPSAALQEELDIRYAEDYTATIDMNLIIKNYKYLGGA